MKQNMKRAIYAVMQIAMRAVLPTHNATSVEEVCSDHQHFKTSHKMEVNVYFAMS